MAMWEMGLGSATTALVIAALPLVACGKASRGDGPRGSGSSGSSGSSQSGGREAASGSTGSPGSSGSGGSTGSLGGSDGVGGEAVGSAAMGGSAAAAGNAEGAGTAGSPVVGDAGGGGVGEGEGLASLHWIDGTHEHRARGASSTEPARLRTLVVPRRGTSALVGTSELIIGKHTDELYIEGILWTQESGTTALGGLPGVIEQPFKLLSFAHAVSADSSVVVGAARNSQDIVVPFRWTRADGMEPLAESGTASAVSEDGSVVVGSVSTDQQALFRWTRERGAVTIVEPLPGDAVTRLLALSDDGATLLGLSETSELDARRASRLIVWTEGSGVRAIENLPGYPWCTAEFAEFDPTHGFVAGGWCWGEIGHEPFIWAGQDALVALGPADALDGYEPFQPAAVTPDGSVAVGMASNADNSGRGFRWTEAEGFEFIELPQGYTSSRLGRRGEEMSADGSVIVGTLDSGVYRAFRWSEDAGTVVLPPLAGHDVSSASVVSADGSVVAGTSQLGASDLTAVYWLADGVPHRIADELESHGIELGAGKLQSVRAVQTPLAFLGYGAKDELGAELMWRATLP